MSALLATSSNPPATGRTVAREPAVLQSLLTAPCWLSTSWFRVIPEASALPGSKAWPNSTAPAATASATITQATGRRSRIGRLPTTAVQRRGDPDEHRQQRGPDHVLAERQRHADDRALQQVGPGAGDRREPGQRQLLGGLAQPAKEIDQRHHQERRH